MLEIQTLRSKNFGPKIATQREFAPSRGRGLKH